MDRKSVIVLLVSFLLIIGWFELVKVLYPPPSPRAAAKGTNTVANATNTPVPATGTTLAAPTLAAPAPGPATQWSAPSAKEEFLELETAEVKYTFTTHGGGVKLAELKRFPKIIGNRKATDPARVVTLNTKAPVGAMTLLGGDALQGDGLFVLAKTDKGVRAEKMLPTGLRIVKEFTPSTNYLMQVSVWLENTRGEPIAVPEQQWVIGTATPINPLDKGQLMKVSWFGAGKSDSVTEAWFENATLGCFPGTKRTEHTTEGKLAWAAAQNQFFTMVAVPKQPAEKLLTLRVPSPRTTRPTCRRATPPSPTHLVSKALSCIRRRPSSPAAPMPSTASSPSTSGRKNTNGSPSSAARWATTLISSWTTAASSASSPKPCSCP